MSITGNQIMYVANTTTQHAEYNFRVPENPKIINVRIRAGQQAKLWEGTTMDIAAIVEQLSPYGLIKAAEISRKQPFIGCCYSLDRPIDIDKLRTAFKHNDDVLIKRGHEMRVNAAIAVDAKLTQDEPGYGGNLEMEVAEVEVPGGRERQIESERIEIVREGEEPRDKRRRAAGGRR